MTMPVSDGKGSDDRSTIGSRSSNDDIDDGDGCDRGDGSGAVENARRHHSALCKEMPPPLPSLERHVGSYRVPGAFSMQPSSAISTSPSHDVPRLVQGDGCLEASRLPQSTAVHASLWSALSPPMRCDDERSRNCRTMAAAAFDSCDQPRSGSGLDHAEPATPDTSDDCILPVAALVLPALVASISTATMSSDDFSAEASTTGEPYRLPYYGPCMLNHGVEIAQEVYGGRIAVDVDRDPSNTTRRPRSWTLCLFKWSGIAILLLVATVLPATYKPMGAASIPTTVPNTTTSTATNPLSLLPWCVASDAKNTEINSTAFNNGDVASAPLSLAVVPPISTMALGICELLFPEDNHVIVDSITVDTGTVYVTCLNVDSDEQKMINQTLPITSNTADLCLDASNSSDSSSSIIAQANTFSETVPYHNSSKHAT